MTSELKSDLQTYSIFYVLLLLFFFNCYLIGELQLKRFCCDLHIISHHTHTCTRFVQITDSVVDIRPLADIDRGCGQERCKAGSITGELVVERRRSLIR